MQVSEVGPTGLDVRDVATREDERSRLLVKLREFGFECEMHRAVSSNVASSAGTRSILVESVAEQTQSECQLVAVQGGRNIAEEGGTH